MVWQSRHVSARIDRPIDEVYDYASNPASLGEWAAGLGSSFKQVDGQWVIDSEEGRTLLTFAPRNAFGVLDHWVTTPQGQTVYVPLRVIADGSGCEVVLTVRRLPEMSDQDFERDVAAVAADLATLKQVLERG